MSTRPKLRLPYSNGDRVLELVAAAAAVGLCAFAAIPEALLPQKVPTHFNLAGLPDAWGERGDLARVPLVALGLYVVLTLVSRIPHTFGYAVPITFENAARQYRIGRRATLILKAYMTWLYLGLLTGSAAVARGCLATLTVLPIISLYLVLGLCFVGYFVASKRAR